MQIPRILLPTVQSKIGEGKAIIIMGPRQAGKSTLLHELVLSKNHSLSISLTFDTTAQRYRPPHFGYCRGARASLLENGQYAGSDGIELSRVTRRLEYLKEKGLARCHVHIAIELDRHLSLPLADCLDG